MRFQIPMWLAATEALELVQRSVPGFGCACANSCDSTHETTTQGASAMDAVPLRQRGLPSYDVCGVHARVIKRGLVKQA